MALLSVICSNLVLLVCTLQSVWGTSRHDRVWPLSATDTVDLGQSSAFGPRLLASQSLRYDFHRGVDIPTPEGTPVHAIDGGSVRIAGSNPHYTDLLVQVKHTDWDELPDSVAYSNYMHLLNVTVSAGDTVAKGDLVGYTSHPSSGNFDHLHFEIRTNGLYQRHCCNPWKYLPNADNNYTSFVANVTLTPNYSGCNAVVNVSVPPNQLMFNHIQLTIDNGTLVETREYDMCEDNLTHSFSEMDNPLFEDNLYISPKRFSSQSYAQGEWAGYGFDFLDLGPAGSGGTVAVTVADVFGNAITSDTMTYTC